MDIGQENVDMIFLNLKCFLENSNTFFDCCKTITTKLMRQATIERAREYGNSRYLHDLATLTLRTPTLVDPTWPRPLRCTHKKLGRAQFTSRMKSEQPPVDVLQAVRFLT